MIGGESSNVVIVGAGQAGARAALALRSSGHRGSITLIGAEAHLPYERPQLSKDMLLNPAAKAQFIKSAQDWAAVGVTLRAAHPVISVDADRRFVAMADGSTEPFDRMLLATGMSPRRCAALEASRVPVRYLRTIDDSNAIRSGLVPHARVVLIGAGIIGLEVAAAAAAAGCKVTVVETADRLLSRALPAVVGCYLQGVHVLRGVSFRFGVMPTRTEDDAVVLSDGARLPADLIVIGIGVEPSAEIVSAFGLPAAHSFKVDSKAATEIEGVYAAGDAAVQYSPWHGRWMRIDTWANAQNQALAAGKAMLGLDVHYEEPLWFWSDQYDVNLQVVGDAVGEEQVIRGEIERNKFIVVALRDGEVVGGVTVNDPRSMGALRKLVANRRRCLKTDLENVTFDLRKAALT